MKSLVLKDLYTILHNSKAFLVMIVAMGFFLSFSSEGSGGFYTIFCCMMCAMLVVTTFSFDNLCSWEPYAMILPITRRDVVRGKFALLLLVSAVGALLGFAMSILTCAVLPSLTLDLKEQVFYLLPGFSVAMFMGSLSIPLIFKFGAEKARMLLIASFALPAILLALVLRALEKAGVHLTDQMVIRFFSLAPVLVLVFAFLMYLLSCRIFEEKEL